MIRTEVSPPPKRRYRSIRFLLRLSVLIAAFSLLAFLVNRSDLSPVDLEITRILQSLSSPFLTGVMTVLSWVGYTPQSFLFTALVVVSLYLVGLHWEALVGLLACVTEELLNLLLKMIIHRPRPSADLVQVFKTLSGYSFPSGHVMFYTCIFGYLWYLCYALLVPSWKRTSLSVIAAGPLLLVGISRIYLGEHWASDVLGGYIMGGIVLAVTIQFYRWGKGRFFAKQPVARGRR